MQSAPTQEEQIGVPSVGPASDAKANFWQRLGVALFEPVDIAFLVFFRIVCGLHILRVDKPGPSSRKLISNLTR